MFNSYVSNVLPELGEENMQQVTFQEYLDHRLSKEFQVENPYRAIGICFNCERILLHTDQGLRVSDSKLRPVFLRRSNHTDNH